MFFCWIEVPNTPIGWFSGTSKILIIVETVVFFLVDWGSQLSHRSPFSRQKPWGSINTPVGLPKWTFSQTSRAVSYVMCAGELWIGVPKNRILRPVMFFSCIEASAIWNRPQIDFFQHVSCRTRPFSVVSVPKNVFFVFLGFCDLAIWIHDHAIWVFLSIRMGRLCDLAIWVAIRLRFGKRLHLFLAIWNLRFETAI